MMARLALSDLRKGDWSIPTASEVLGRDTLLRRRPNEKPYGVIRGRLKVNRLAAAGQSSLAAE